MNSPSPIDSLKFVAARADDLLEHVHFQAVVTHDDEELGAVVETLRSEILQAATQHIDDHPLIYSDGTSVKTELTLDHVTHVRFPSHPARGGESA